MVLSMPGFLNSLFLVLRSVMFIKASLKDAAQSIRIYVFIVIGCVTYYLMLAYNNGK